MSGRDTATLLAEYAGAGCLVYGIGNVGRQDDGLGWAFVDWLEDSGRATGTELVRSYQLQLEDAHLVARFPRVLFVDASRDPALADFAVLRPEPAFDVPFTSHALTVATVLATARLCFGRLPDARLLALRGYSWELVEELTEEAHQNLAAATAALTHPAAAYAVPASPLVRGGRP